MSDTKRVLVTGARAPVAVDWARALMRQGHQVFMTDCSRFPLARFLKGTQGYLRTPPPRQAFSDYKEAVLQIIDAHNIDMVIPTCEEVFYLAQIKAERPDVDWVLADLDLLHSLHNKKQIFEVLEGLPEIKLPDTNVVTAKQQIEISPETILKPVYSRFGEEIIRDVTKEAISGIEVSNRIPWVQQQKLRGKAICLYALFSHGKLIAHQSYLPRYCLNKSAASYFEPIADKRIQRFLEAFGERHQFHGQASFDFMEDEGDLYVIECNPRATSGLHLVAEGIDWGEDGFIRSSNHKSTPKHLGSVMLLSDGLSTLTSKKSWHDYRTTRCAIDCKRYPISGLAPLFVHSELIYNAIKQKRTLSAATTFDIEWDGENAC
ncbi:hypothetical protein VINI7043_23742 [Vibrio nigripulchritudo ATCC 27043]|uniref:hypothetical protein n=1 Tax=Vibrio nigripulchritudo TaxID=28173 RepID=UPI00021C3BE3|nr:hypothetical protein [Vibrio nigripulchritudo]EGU52711.1 hypothetical protein VINI7043_23742 [Vibrio nigripulchritudo ATCC 27043]